MAGEPQLVKALKNGVIKGYTLRKGQEYLMAPREVRYLKKYGFVAPSTATLEAREEVNKWQ